MPILGATGDLGLGLALRLTAAGVPVRIGSRSAERAQAAAERVRAAVPGADIDGLANEDAVAGADMVVLSVPFPAQIATLASIKESLAPGTVLVDCTVPLAAAVGGRATRALGVPQGSAAQAAQESVPDGVTVVGAFHTVSASTLADLDRALDEDVLLCGERKADKARVARLVESVPGLRAVNAGALEMARVVEQLTPMLISINARYKTHAGIRILGLPEAPHWPAAA
ncbi:MAG: 8-hydroxy-5-deazaflavin:NADPH oxidoreductase [Thermoleophilales bacterium]|nr:8-hydroxy-5-deazaflavin:NADPH oxidoreductase [Thermoleophilales bacterium]